MIAATILVLVAIAYRLVLGLYGNFDLGWLPNFSPIAALVLCGAAFFPRKRALVVLFALLFVSDLVLNAHRGFPLLDARFLPSYLALGLVAGAGFWLRDHRRLGWLLAGTVAGSVVFYVLTNTGSWLADPGYAKTAAGWLQALTTGLPGYPPTWTFFRNSLVSDLTFTLLFAGCMALSARRATAPVPAGVPAAH